MPKRNELNAGMEIDSNETFGELLFLRMKTEKSEVDEDTGERKSTHRRYVVQSRKQLAEEIITIPIETPLRELVAGDKVEIVNPTTNLYAFGNGNFANSYIQVFAEDIKKVSEPVKAPSDPKNQKSEQNK
ncbi:DUF961 family protein [Enterococcus faecium]|uniref:DUF961 family protein n=1 Tax=Enterococcus faecium TaxID=1352 RepID=UPI000BEF21CD|nr:DUF961 family protein [Enterococcus faecium]PEH49621.1 hypothetical protein CRM75_01170 [Enterococcus faecium]